MALEGIINRQNVASFFRNDDVNSWYIEFAHRYAIGAVDKRSAEARMSDPQDSVDIFHEITYKQEAYMFLVLANNYMGWQVRLEADKNDKCHKLSAGKWTQVTKTTGNKSLRVANRSGWSEDGIGFYKSCMMFFKDLRSSSEFQSYREKAKYWHMVNVVGKRNESVRKRAKRGRGAIEEDNANPEAFADWETDGLWGS